MDKNPIRLDYTEVLKGYRYHVELEPDGCRGHFSARLVGTCKDGEELHFDNDVVLTDASECLFLPLEPLPHEHMQPIRNKRVEHEEASKAYAALMREQDRIQAKFAEVKGPDPEAWGRDEDRPAPSAHSPVHDITRSPDLPDDLKMESNN